jgi:murein DD-endopeptidase MepM/ murein hydrolase activator NlpD
MRPVAEQFAVTQAFGSYATGGVAADPNGTEVQQLVAQYGNYQPYGHAGQDIGCPIGTPVHAIAAGTVLWADWGTNLPGDETDAGYRERWYLYKTFPGIVTVIQHDGWISVYAHLSEAPLNPGDTVTEGQQIALSGNTRSPGVSLGAHLHVEALIDLSFATGNGLIYGRTDPTPFFNPGAITVQSTTPPAPGVGPDQQFLIDLFGSL